MAQILLKITSPASQLAISGLRPVACQHQLESLATIFSSSRQIVRITPRILHITQRHARAERKADQADSVVMKSRKKPDSGQMTVGDKVVQAGKDTAYTVTVIIGITITGALFYLIARELLSGQSPSGIYSDAFKRCKNSEQVQDRLGMPLKAHGEMNRRGRRRHTSHVEYEVDGVKFLKMKFYLEGSIESATVHLEMKQNENGRYEYRYLFVECDEYPHRTIILEDNR